MDLTPRPAAPAERRARRRWGSIALLIAVFVVGGVVVTKFLTSAIDYYCNVDEIDRKEGCEAGKRIRIQGTVEEGSVAKTGDVTTFRMAFNNRDLEVHYQGDTPALFQECIPVVVHGTLDGALAAGGVFNGTEIEIRHSNEYEAKNKDRLDKARSAACTQAQA